MEARARATPGRWAPVLIALLAAAALAPDARAHATLVRSSPPDAGVVTRSPRLVNLWFSEAISPRLSSVTLYDARHRRVAARRLNIDAPAPDVLSVSMPALPRGAYSLDWRVLSDDDVHVTRGTLIFGVGSGVAVPRRARGQATATDPIDVVRRWLGLAFLAGLVGGLAFARLVLEPVAEGTGSRALAAEAWRARRRTLRLAAWSGAAAVWVGAVWLAVQVAETADSAAGRSVDEQVWRVIAGTRWGTLWLLREGSVLLMLGLTLVLLRDGGDRPAHRARRRHAAWGAVIPASLALVVAQALGSHAAAVPSGRTAAVLADAAHVLAAYVWVGGLIASIAVVGLALRRSAGTEAAALARACVARFGVLAAVSVGLLAATGLYSMGQQVGSIDALAETLYGRALVGKTGVLLVAGTLGLASALLVHPRLASPLARLFGRPRGWTPGAPGRLRRFLGAESAAAAAVLLAASVITASAPARASKVLAAPSPPMSRTHTVGDLLVTLTVKPSRPGPNVATVRVASLRRPPLGEVRRVRLRFTRAGTAGTVTAVARNAGRGAYRLAGEQLGAEGSWRIDAVVERVGAADVTSRFDWPVTARPRPAVLVSNRPLRPLLTRASGAVLLVLVACLAWRSLGRRRHAIPTVEPLGKEAT